MIKLTEKTACISIEHVEGTFSVESSRVVNGTVYFILAEDDSKPEWNPRRFILAGDGTIVTGYPSCFDCDAYLDAMESKLNERKGV